jgi:hypothetical protein
MSKAQQFHIIHGSEEHLGPLAMLAAGIPAEKVPGETGGLLTHRLVPEIVWSFISGVLFLLMSLVN